MIIPIVGQVWVFKKKKKKDMGRVGFGRTYMLAGLGSSRPKTDSLQSQGG